MELRRRLKRKLKALMNDQTQEVFAQRIGISQASLNRALKGEQDIGIDMIEKICKFTSTSVEDLLGADKQMGTRENENHVQASLIIPNAEQIIESKNQSSEELSKDLGVAPDPSF